MRLFRYLLVLILLPAGLTAARLDLTCSFSANDIPLQGNTLSNYGFITAPGLPRLPVKTLNILLPKDASISSWDCHLLGESFISAPAPAVNSGFADGERYLDAPVRDIGTQRCVYLGVKQWGDMRFASFRVLPAVYDDAGKGYRMATGVAVGIEYAGVEKHSYVKGRIPLTYKAMDSASGFFANASMLPQWYSPTQSKDYDILIVSLPHLYSAFSAWEAFRNGQGLSTNFANISTILASSPGSNDAEKLRNYVAAQYAQQSFGYLLLIGDHDTVPTAYLTPEPDGSETVPSDFYYSDLSSIFDADGDNRLGEYSTGFGDQDYLVDFTPEVFVGRISTNSATEVSAIAQRVVSFEQDNGEWKNHALLPAAFLNYQGEPETIFLQTDGADFMEYEVQTVLSSMTCETMYEHTGVVPSHPSDFDLSYDTLAGLISTQSYGLLSWSAHGSATSSSRKVWINDDNQNQLPDSWEMDWMNMVNRNSFNAITNPDGMVVFAASCYNGMIDNDNSSLAEHALIKKGVAVLGATRTGWYKIGWKNPGWGGLSSYNHHFLENYVSNGMSVGAAHAWTNLLHTQYYMFGDPVDSNGIIYPELQNVYTYMLFGDPLIGHTTSQEPTQGEILVWEPMSSEALNVVNAINASGRYNVIYTDKLIPDYSYLDRFEAVFCLFGWGDTTYVMNPGSLEYNLLNSYLDSGGKLWAEGWMPWDPSDPFWGKFGVHAPLDMLLPIGDILYQHGSQNMIWDYSLPDVYTQALLPTMPASTTLFTNQYPQYPDHALAIYNSNGSYRTVAASFQLCKIADAANTLPDMLSVICDTLGIGSGGSVDMDDPLTPEAWVVSNYPNPFSDTSIIKFDLAMSAPVRIDIYNTRGQRVRSIELGNLTKGTSIARWDGRDDNGHLVASGIYAARISRPGYHKTLKMLYMK
jgi:hypothetical protein